MSFTLCIELPELPDPFEIVLPGGISISDINLMQMIQPALTPLVPIFDIVDVVVALFNCMKSLPDVLGPPPDPTIIAACVPQVAEKVAKLLRLVPQLSLPMTAVGVIDLIIRALRDARTLLLHLQQQMVQILGAIDRATDLEDAGLMAVIECARANVAQEAANVGKSLASMGKLIGLLNLFLGMIGAPEVPDLSSLAGRPLNAAIQPLDELIQTLRSTRALIPLP